MDDELLIDVHHHVVPPAIQGLVRKNPEINTLSASLQAYSSSSPALSIELMDSSKIGAAVLSVPRGSFTSNSGGDIFQYKNEHDIFRKNNEYLASVRQEFPRRFGFLASLPLPDVDAALEEIEFAGDELDADGFAIVTNYEGLYLGDQVFDPILDELNRRKAVVFVHPTVTSQCAVLSPHILPIFLEGPFDTTRAVMRLIFNRGTYRWPSIKFIFCHGGGTVPYLIDRVEMARDWYPNLAEFMPRGVRHEINKFWYDIPTVSAESMQTLTNIVASERLLYGSDAPFLRPDHTSRHLEKAVSSNIILKRIKRANALELFPGLA